MVKILLQTKAKLCSVGGVGKNIAISAGSLSSISGLVKSYTEPLTASHRCDVSSKLCCTGAKP